MVELELPVLRNDGSVGDNLNDNAILNILPARYAQEGEQVTDIFERVAKNVAVAELIHTDASTAIGAKHIKPDHPRRDELLEEVFGTSDLRDHSQVHVKLSESNAKYVEYDAIYHDLNNEDREILETTKNEFQMMMEKLAFTPNSPTLMNAGGELQQLSACFVISPDDDIDDIHDTAREAAKVFQSGGGMGYGFWTLRPKGESVGSTGGIASGPITFMRTYDQMCETIAQGGTRRGAQMGVMKVDHPDVIEFIHAKRKDVSLANSLRLNDPDDFTHSSFAEALEEARKIIDENGRVPEHLRNAVEGHLSNFNISVGVTDEFMDAVESNGLFQMRHPSTGEPFKANADTVEMYKLYGLGEYVDKGSVVEIPAREIWNKIIEGAHENGEPGVVFIDRFNKEHSFPVDMDEPLQNQEYSMLATNPCVTGDTLVAVADGRVSVPIKELVGEEGIPLYSRKNDDVVVQLAKNVRKTREDAELVRVETDGNASLRLTEDHPVWTRNRGWIEAGNLEEGDSLHILYETDHNAGYNNVQWTGSDPWNLEHRMVAQDILKMDISDMNVHHKNGDKTDNRPENLELIDPAEHGSMHSRDVSGEKNMVYDLKRRGEFEEYKERNPFYDTAGENNPMSGERDEIKCLECGDTFKAVTNTHLKKDHDMTTDEYKEKYDNPDMVRVKKASNHKVTAVKPAGTEDVYDLEVPDTRNFYASQEGGEYINIHNCGEQPLMEYEACNLGHINLSTIVDDDRQTLQEWLGDDKLSEDHLEQPVEVFLNQAIDWDEFNHRIMAGTRFLDNVVTMSDFPVEKIEQTVSDNRKIGLGVMGLAQLFVQLGVEYGSDIGNEVARQLMLHINHMSKMYSQELATERGSFENWEDSKYADPTSYPEWFKKQTGEDPVEWDEGFPMRNHNTTTIAPTGTTSMIANTSGGCEPIYSVGNFKNVSDDIQGDAMLQQFDSLFLEVLRQNEIDVETVKDEIVEQMEANEFVGVNGLETVPDEIADLFVTTSDLTAIEHAGVQCAMQEGVDSAISKTVNAPNDATIDDTRQAMEFVYDNGGKGVTYYRDGTRSKQVLTTRSNNQEFGDGDLDVEDITMSLKEQDKYDQLVELVQEDIGSQTAGTESSQSVSEEDQGHTPRERPNSLQGKTYRVKTGYGRMYVTVNDHKGEPFEVIATIGKSGGLMESMIEGMARMVSSSLRAGMDVSAIIDQLRGIRSPKIGWDNGEQIQSIPDGIAKVLIRHTGNDPALDGDEEDDEVEPQSKNIIKEESEDVSVQVAGALFVGICPDCPGDGQVVMQEGCKHCESCGWSEC